MAILPIHTYGDPILRRKSAAVEKITDEVLVLALDMLETMRDAEGIGLAAIQVGRPVRMLVADIGTRGPAGAPKIFINPVILGTEGESVFDEGCLSVPGVSAEITRPDAILLHYTDGKGKERKDRFDELLARVLQHEIDHLDGKLFVDYLNPIRRAQVLRKVRAILKAGSGGRAPAM